MRYNSTGVKVYVDDQLVVNDLVYSATIGIGKYNGGGMLQTPDAVADDGLFDLTACTRRASTGGVRYASNRHPKSP